MFVCLFVCLFVVVGCPTNTTGPEPTEPTTNTNPTNTNPTNGNGNGNTVDIPVERPLHVISIPENTITRSVSIDTNILDLYLSSGYNADDFSITHLSGIDENIIDVNALNFNGKEKTLSGTIVLKQRLDFENPTDGGENSGDNDYEVATFRVMSETSSNDFKLIVRITDLTAEPQKLEILVDSLHLDEINEKRGIREIYLYEDKNVMDPLMGDDSNNFLIADLVESRSVRGDVDASTDLTKLYDRNDRVDAFLTATPVNNSGDTYHRLTLNFTEEVNIQKVGIRGRQIGGYYGFVFILRDKDNNIIYVHRVSHSLSRGSGSDETATSTYAFIADYIGFPIISDFRISLDNMYFDIAENTTNVILIDNFSVARGYEYERGFVSIDPGVDFDKFNTDDLYFLNNELVGLSFKVVPDAEDKQDADSNNVYELGTVTISNFDGGSLNFSLPVRVVNIPSIVSLHSNAITITIDPSTSIVIENLADTNYLVSSDLSDALNLGLGTYNYEISGTDGDLFETIGNKLITKNGLGLGAYTRDMNRFLKVRYIPENNRASSTLDVTVQTSTAWQKINAGKLGYRSDHQVVVLNNGDIIVLGGKEGGDSRYQDVVRSRDGGTNWSLVTRSVPWYGQIYFQAVALNNDDILVMGGSQGIFASPNNRVYRGRDGGANWEFVTYAPWAGRKDFQAVVLNNGDILVMGGANTVGGWYSGGHDKQANPVNDIWKSSDDGVTWSQIPASNHWAPRYGFQAVVLDNDDILVMGGSYELSRWGVRKTLGDIWKSEDGGTNWTAIPNNGNRWPHRYRFQSTVLPNGDLLVMGGYHQHTQFRRYGSIEDIWISKDGGNSWTDISQPQHLPRWRDRDSFSATALPNGQCLLIGGYKSIQHYSYSGGRDRPTQWWEHGVMNDIWLIYSGEN